MSTYKNIMQIIKNNYKIGPLELNINIQNVQNNITQLIL